MRRNISLLLTLAGIASTLTLGPVVASAADSKSKQRMHTVERELIPALLMDGAPLRFTTLTRRMQQLHVPGASVAVVHDGKIDWARGYGVAWVGGPAVTADTLFQASSISKPLTALAVLHLAEAGTIDIDRDANHYLRAWKIPETQYTVQSKVTVAELLEHTAGINLPGFPGYTAGQPLPTLLQILQGTPPALGPAITVTSVPGSEWRYAGGGYVILRQLLADVTGQPFERLMRDSVLLPLGMTRSTFQQPLPAELATAAARPHDEDGRNLEHGARIYPEQAPDGLWTTAPDLARYIIAVQQSLKGHGFLSKDMARRMLTPGMNHWGIGLMIGQDSQHPYFMFSGGNYGFLSYFVAYDNGDGLAILTNGERGYDLVADIRRSMAQVYGWPDFQPLHRHPIPAAAGSQAGLVGVYRDAAESMLAITREKGDLFLTRIGSAAGPRRLYPLAPDRFLLGTPLKEIDPDTVGEEVVLGRDADGSGHTLKLVPPGSAATTTAIRLDAQTEQPVLEELAQTARRYRQQLPASGGTDALRRLIVAMAAGKPEDARVGPGFRSVILTDRIPNQQIFAARGSIVSISYDGTSPGGYDAYRVQFSNGDCFVHLLIDPDGVIQALELHVD